MELYTESILLSSLSSAAVANFYCTRTLSVQICRDRSMILLV